MAIEGRSFKIAITFVGGAATFIDGAVIFIGKGSSAIRGRLFKIARVRLYYYWAYRDLYKLSCYRSLALVKGEGKASRAYTGGAYADGACIDGAYADRAYIDRAYIDGAAY